MHLSRGKRALSATCGEGLSAASTPRPAPWTEQEPGSSYSLHWGWSGGRLCSSSVCRRQAASLAHCTLPTAAEGSRVTHFEPSCYRARNLHSSVAVYPSRDDLKLKSMRIQDVATCSRFNLNTPFTLKDDSTDI